MNDKGWDIPFEACPHTISELEDLLSPLLNAEALDLFSQYITNRHSAYHNKLKGGPAPWSHDPILQVNRFTNIFREYDRESLNLIHMIIDDPSLTMREKQMNCLLFRSWNLGQSFKVLGGPWTVQDIQDNWEITLARARAQYAEAPKEQNWFTHAFMTSGMLHGLTSLSIPRLGPNCPQALKPLVLAHEFLEKVSLKTLPTARQEYESLLGIRGLGPFLAYQVWVDWTYIPEYPYSENHFTIAGPGCIKGLRELIPNWPAEVTYEEGIYWLVYRQYRLIKRPINLYHDRRGTDQQINLMAMENCLCEFSKYSRLSRGDTMKTRRFPGVKPITKITDI